MARALGMKRYPKISMEASMRDVLLEAMLEPCCRKISCTIRPQNVFLLPYWQLSSEASCQKQPSCICNLQHDSADLLVT